MTKLQPFLRRILTVACAIPALWLALSATAAAPTGGFLTGGIGEEERLEMRALRDQYNLRLIFAQARTGEYLAGVTVSISKSGSDSDLGPYHNSGPWFFVRLDPGSYRVSATYGGATQTRSVRIGGGASERVLYWPAR